MMSAQKALTRLATAAIGIGSALSLANTALYTVDGGHRAVLFDRFRGVLDQSVGEGTHFLVPILQKPFMFEIRTKPRTISTVTALRISRWSTFP